MHCVLFCTLFVCVLGGLNLTSDWMAQCLIQGARRTFTSSKGILSANSDSLAKYGVPKTRKRCTITIRLPPTRVMNITQVQLLGQCRDVTINVVSGRTRESIIPRTLLSCSDAYFQDVPNPRRYRIFSPRGSTVTFTLTFGSMVGSDKISPFSMFVSYTAVPEPTQLLRVTYTSSMMGSVTSLGWDGVSSYYFALDTWTRVAVPASHVIMVSMRHMNLPRYGGRHCERISVALYADHTPTTPLSSYCESSLPSPEVFDLPSRVLHVHFVSYSRRAMLGFNLSFSFYLNSSRPQQGPGGLWNCSVPQWAELKHHFPCNLQADCVGMEDEERCPYTSAGCGLGRVSVGDGCYIYVVNTRKRSLRDQKLSPAQQGKTVSWGEAQDLCHNYGAELASLNTYQENRAVKEMLFKTDQYQLLWIGLNPVELSVPYLYRDMWKHVDDTIAYYMEQIGGDSFCNSQCMGMTSTKLRRSPCGQRSEANILCELPHHVTLTSVSLEQNHTLQTSLSRGEHPPVDSFQECPSGHVTHSFLACDFPSACWNQDSVMTSACEVQLSPLPPSFTCEDNAEHVSYTLVCDHKADCHDNSDEDFCQYEPCDATLSYECRNKECVDVSQMCDEVPHCTDASDEHCGLSDTKTDVDIRTPPPAVVTFDGYGGVTSQPLSRSTVVNPLPVCPETHLQCADDGYCLPVFVRCNNLHDCPQHEDEENCDSYICPGFYRCRASTVCLHPQHVCDGMFQCPQRDDELLCDSTCPEPCTCYGHALFCGRVFPSSSYPDLRFLDASDSGLQYADVSSNTLLVYLSLARCGLRNLTLHRLANLHSLDLSENYLTSITDQHVSLLPHLRHLTLSDNPLYTLIHYTQTTTYLHQCLHSLDLSRVYLKELDVSMLHMFPHLLTLNLTNCGVDRVLSGGFQSLPHLTVLDTRGCSMEHFSGGIFEDLDTLQAVFADNYKLCCQEIIPKAFSPDRCHAPSDEISSCEDLLRSDIYRAVLVMFSVLAILGNAASFLVRIVRNIRGKMGFDVFVANLSLSDFLMGLYLALIGVADHLYRGTYLWNDVTWKQSMACRAAGLLSLLSSEVSAFIICLITVDRLLVLRFPFSSLHFHRTSAVMTCAGVWTVGLLLAAIPLLPVTSHWQFYGQNGICIPLPITRKEFSGRTFAFNVMIVLNFVLFVLIAVGQAVIYQSVQQNRLADSDCSTRSRKDRTLARRLLTIAVSDFLCWFPVGLLGLLASRGHAVAGEVNVAMAILVLPLNSAINPFLYTLNMMMERLRLQRQQRMKQFLLTQLQQQDTHFSVTSCLFSCSTEEAVQIFTRWLHKGLLSTDYAMSLLHGKRFQEHLSSD